jgi:hypothetical protein
VATGLMVSTIETVEYRRGDWRRAGVGSTSPLAGTSCATKRHHRVMQKNCISMAGCCNNVRAFHN